MTKNRSIAIANVAHYGLVSINIHDDQKHKINQTETIVWQMLYNINESMFSNAEHSDMFINKKPLSVNKDKIRANLDNVAIIDIKDFYIHLMHKMMCYHSLPISLEEFFNDLYSVFTNSESSVLEKLSARTCLRLMYKILSNNKLYKIKVYDHSIKFDFTYHIEKLIIDPLNGINALQANFADLLIVDADKLDDCLSILENNFRMSNITIESKVLTNHNEIADYSKILHAKFSKILKKKND